MRDLYWIVDYYSELIENRVMEGKLPDREIVMELVKQNGFALQ